MTRSAKWGLFFGAWLALGGLVKLGEKTKPIPPPSVVVSATAAPALTAPAVASAPSASAATVSRFKLLECETYVSDDAPVPVFEFRAGLADFNEMVGATEDNEIVLKALKRNHAWPIKPHTRCKILDTEILAQARRIVLLDGEHKGDTGWVNDRFLLRRGHEEPGP